MSAGRTTGTIGATIGLVLASMSGVLTSVGNDTSTGARGASAATANVASTSTHVMALFLPDPDLHPGKRSSMTTAQLCDPSFRTGSVRPTTSYTNKVKVLMLGNGGSISAPSGTNYRVKGEHLPGAVGDYELDHLINLAIGGHPEDPKNLWMEPWEKKGRRLAPIGYGAETKDVLENRLRREVCNGTIGITVAQRQISVDWTTAKAVP